MMYDTGMLIENSCRKISATPTQDSAESAAIIDPISTFRMLKNTWLSC
jgi:hypothetical protein